MISNSSVSGSSVPTWLVSPISSGDMSCQVEDLSTWYETDETGQETVNPLGTSGTFVITIGWEQAECEKIQCSSINVATKTITFVQRGYDGTQAKAHAAGTLRNPNVFPVFSAADLVSIDLEIGNAIDMADQAQIAADVAQASADNAQLLADLAQELALTAQTTADQAVADAEAAQITADNAQSTAESAQSTAESAQSTAESAQSTAESAQSTAESAQSTADNAYTLASGAVQSVTAANGTITIGGTADDPTVAVGTVPYSSISGTPSSLPPSGSAGGDLTGTYPNPTLAAVGTSGTYGSSTKVPVITTDAKGRVTSVTETTVANDAPSGPAGGDLTGTYPDPTLAAVGTSGTKGSASAVPVFVTDSKGRVTSSTDTPIQISESQVTNLSTDLASKLPLAGGTMSGDINLNGHALNNVSVLDMDGLTGATAATRFVGGTVSGHPTTGTFAVGDFVMDNQATLWVCIIAGSPGTWSPVPANAIYKTSTSRTADLGEITLVQGSGSGVTITLPANPVAGSTFMVINSANNPISIKGGSWPLFINGNNYGAGTSYTVAVNGIYSFVFSGNSDDKWYAVSTNDIGDMVNYGDVSLSQFGAPTANLSVGSHKITNLANGTASSDAATFGQIPTSLPPSGTASGDLAGSYPAPTLATLSPSPAGTYGSTLLIPQVTVDAKGRVTAVATNTVNDTAKLPLAGGTMAGNIAMSTNNITGLGQPQASSDAARADAAGGLGIPPGLLYLDKAHTFDPTVGNTTFAVTTGNLIFTAIHIPYRMTITSITNAQATGNSQATTTWYELGLYNSTTLLGSTGNLNSIYTQLTGVLSWSLTSPITVNPGIYWVAFLWTGTANAPTLYTNAGTTLMQGGSTIVQGQLNLRAVVLGSRTTLPASLTGINTLGSSVRAYWAGVR